MMRIPDLVLLATVLALFPAWGAALTESERQLAAGHPRPGYEEVADIKAMADALRKELSQRERYSFSRGWWTWHRLRARYVDDGRRNRNELCRTNRLILNDFTIKSAVVNRKQNTK